MANSINKYFVARQQCIGDPLLYFRGNSEYFYIVNSYMCVNNNVKGTYYCFSMATKVTRTLHNISLFVGVHCLSRLILSHLSLYSTIPSPSVPFF
jgi:hypothetical protein